MERRVDPNKKSTNTTKQPKYHKININDASIIERFVVACSHRVPNVNWIETMDLDATSLPGYKSFHTDGFKIPIIRQLIVICWKTTGSNGFCCSYNSRP